MSVAYCPERVLPGQILKELEGNDRIVGGLSANCGIRAQEFYSKFVDGQCFLTNARTAEMCKLSENAYRDVNIAFANELSSVCEHWGVDVWKLIEFANHHPRVNVLKPGPGVGGHCVAIDPQFLIHSLPEQTKLMQQARSVNDDKPMLVVNKIVDAVKKVEKPVLACFGLAFKANVEDLRESPALKIVRKLGETCSCPILVVEPHVRALPDALMCYDNISFVSQDVALAKANIVVGLVDHKDFLAIESSSFEQKIVIDTRGMWTL